MAAPKHPAPDPFARISEDGWEAIGAFLRRIANERAEKAKAQQATPERKAAA
jgi:hypothetical protein